MRTWADYTLTCFHGVREGVDSHSCGKCQKIAKKLGYEPIRTGYIFVKDPTLQNKESDMGNQISNMTDKEFADYKAVEKEVHERAQEDLDVEAIKEALREKKEEWKTENLKYREKLQGFLDEFYADRDVPDEFKLGFKDRGIYGAFRMESVRAEDLTDKEQAESYEKYREEMEDFTKFLKDKFFEED